MLPLSIMLLRVYELGEAQTVPFIPEYGGCTSWVELVPRMDLTGLKPVLPDEEFHRQVDLIKGSLGLTLAAG